MTTTPMMPPMGDANFDGGAPALPPQPGTDMTGICFRDQLWLNTYPLDRNLVFDYFALSPFYDWTCNNEQLRSRSIHPLDISQLSKMTGSEYMLSEVMEPHLFVIRKQKRDGPEKVTPMLTYYILDGSIYQAPQLCNVFAGRLKSPRGNGLNTRLLAVAGNKLVIRDDNGVEQLWGGAVIVFAAQCGTAAELLRGRADTKYTFFKSCGGRGLYHISKAFSFASSKLEKTGYGILTSPFPLSCGSLSYCVFLVASENERSASESKAAKETIDFKELKRVDHILASLQRKVTVIS
ncbi:hypothetical protein MTR67_050950 [Solanum verrucosum]|uniref:Mediator of RNA polymerase II transcription subunit 6 n=1 Tax=Solanum verrucosum TaxID=315347 RepID=A0AAF0V2Z8_SOLVR|nr:hypothetical protein MTR67_050950 [Solanum verrucosum]